MGNSELKDKVEGLGFELDELIRVCMTRDLPVIRDFVRMNYPLNRYVNAAQKNDILTEEEKNAAGVIVGEGVSAPKPNPHCDMRLRDEFAMAALPAVIAITAPASLGKVTGREFAEIVIGAAYEMADVAMEVRKK